MTDYEEILKRKRSYSKERYYRLKAAGLCVLCGNVPPTPGRAHCEACRAELYKRGVQRRQEAIEQGLCVRCRRPYNGQYRMCMACRIKTQQEHHDQKLRREERKRHETDHD